MKIGLFIYMKLGLFIFMKIGLFIYIYMKIDLALYNIRWLLCYKTKSNQTKPN